MDRGFHHLAVFVDSHDEMCRLMVESAREGFAASENVIIQADDEQRQRIIALLGSASGSVHFHGTTDEGVSPAVAMSSCINMITENLEAGPRRVRSIRQIRPGWARPYRWVRFEAAANEILADLPFTGVCFYDTRFISDRTRRAVETTHHRLGATMAESLDSPFQDPRRVIEQLPIDRPESGREPTLVLTNIAEFRPVGIQAARMAPPGRAEDVSLVVHELTALAWKKGGGSPTVRVWEEPRRLVIQVQDAGGGAFADPFGGLRPPNKGGEMAVWVAGQLADELAVDQTSATVVFYHSR